MKALQRLDGSDRGGMECVVCKRHYRSLGDDRAPRACPECLRAVFSEEQQNSPPPIIVEAAEAVKER